MIAEVGRRGVGTLWGGARETEGPLRGPQDGHFRPSGPLGRAPPRPLKACLANGGEGEVSLGGGARWF